VTWVMVMAEEVTTTEVSWGPACWRAELRREVVPWRAGMTTESQVEREKFTGEATWKIAWTPGGVLVWGWIDEMAERGHTFHCFIEGAFGCDVWDFEYLDAVTVGCVRTVEEELRA
jgi:hypothetical protein